MATINQKTRKLIGGLILFGALIIFAPSHAATTVAGAICLTKKEARELWPKKHIYWYSKHHCWSNRRGPPRHLKFDLLPNNKASREVMAARSQVPTTKQVFDKTPSEKAHRVIDNPLDIKLNDCCWPDLDRDATGAIVIPDLRTFAERIQDVPMAWWRRKP